MTLGDEIDTIFRREVKTLPAYEKAQAASHSGIAPPVALTQTPQKRSWPCGGWVNGR